MISKKVYENLSKGSFIRKMFEVGNQKRAIYGAENVYDFTLGNPDVPPPAILKENLIKVASSNEPGMHGYMSNAGYPFAREAVANKLSQVYGVDVKMDDVIMTCGAAGAMNCVMKSILNPGEEVIIFAPYFVEYLGYIKNHDGVPVIVETDDNFQIDVEAVRAKINPNTKAMIINSPNNPTGVIYTKEYLEALARVIKEKEEEYSTEIFVISDEPYRDIVFNGEEVPSVFKIFNACTVVNSYSKSLALPGERIGYIAINPNYEGREILASACIYCLRVLGFVNAPALFQRVVALSQDGVVDVDIYKRRRDILYDILINCGFECVKPEGAFYLFPKSPIEDDTAFCDLAADKYNLLLVPGSGFGRKGYFRLSYCISEDIIKRSEKVFRELAKEFSLIK